jgi:hypothetical protein
MGAGYQGYRTQMDRRPVPAEALPQGDHIDRIATGVRRLGGEIVHRAAPGPLPWPRCGGPPVADAGWIRTTHKITCQRPACSDRKPISIAD